MDTHKFYPLTIGGLLNASSDFCVGGREPYQHITRGVPLCGLTCIHAIVSESMGSRFGGPRQKALQTMNEFTLFVDICLIPLSKTCAFDVLAKKL